MSSPLATDELYNRCPSDSFSFATTADLEASTTIIGQERALEALHFGIGIQQEGYNLFALGANGTGKLTAVRRYLEEKAASEETPPDWCYTHNFDQQYKPNMLQLPAGKGRELCLDMESMVEELFTVIPAAFEGEEYQAQKEAIDKAFQKKQEESLEQLADEAKERGIALLQTQNGIAFAPMREGDVVSPEDFQHLSEEEQESIQEEIVDLQEKLQRAMRQVPQWSRESREELKALNRKTAGFAIEPIFDELREKYNDFPDVLAYFDDVEEDILNHFDKFLGQQGEQKTAAAAQQALAETTGGQQQRRQRPSGPDNPFFNRYEINLLVDHADTEGAPLVYENHPTYQNLIGRIEHKAQMGALFTDFTLIKPGALHKANGGYLILDARKVLMQPYTWESLKRALQANQIAVESLGQNLGLISTVSLEPEPIPLDVKVVLLGERRLYYLLTHLDPDFRELFKVAADFENEMPRSEENSQAYARFIASLVQKESLKHFDTTAVSRVIEYSSRIAMDSEKLTTHMQSVADLLREASYWSNEAERDAVQAADVDKAIEMKRYRNGRLRERMQENILRDTVMIDTEGAQIGQINGLSVIQTGTIMFGRPSRITARVRMGKGEVVDIERKAEMGGPIHSKGVMILAGFLGGRYAAERPLSLSASLVFEQSYGGVDGDSASSAELYALLSELAELPIKQSLAVTGSVNQHGQVQAVGGVNQKIEGFFDICEERGFTGEQGVLIPASNVKNLMLRQDVIDAVEAGNFNIYPIESIDEGITLLTGVDAGRPDEDGRYPEETVNGRVAQRIEELAKKQRDFRNENGAASD